MPMGKKVKTIYGIAEKLTGEKIPVPWDASVEEALIVLRDAVSKAGGDVDADAVEEIIRAELVASFAEDDDIDSLFE